METVARFGAPVSLQRHYHCIQTVWFVQFTNMRPCTQILCCWSRCTASSLRRTNLIQPVKFGSSQLSRLVIYRVYHPDSVFIAVASGTPQPTLIALCPTPLLYCPYPPACLLCLSPGAIGTILQHQYHLAQGLQVPHRSSSSHVGGSATPGSRSSRTRPQQQQDTCRQPLQSPTLQPRIADTWAAPVVP